MAASLTLQDIQAILNLVNIKGFSGTFTALGGGQLNDTFLLDFGPNQVILRVSRYEGQSTLQYEAAALQLLDLPQVPKTLFFNPQSLYKGRMWILETRLTGAMSSRLTPPQFAHLGELLAQVHKVKSTEAGVHLWEALLDNCESFGTADQLLAHPDPNLRSLMNKARDLFKKVQPYYNLITPVLIHSDVTPGNMLVDGDMVNLVDWEFAKYRDPMAEFSTMYYEDMEYNQGKWRIKIMPEEKQALFEGYTRAGGAINEDRIQFWMWFDKLCAAAFLYWRLHQSGRPASDTERRQYQHDYDNLITSLNATSPVIPTLPHGDGPPPPIILHT